MEADDTEAFRLFLQNWLDTSGWSQYQLGLATGLGQSLISRWLSPDPNRRTQPSDQALNKLAPVVGRTLEDLMRMAGRLPATTKANGRELPAELAALLSDLEAGWMMASTDARVMAARVVRAVFHVPHRRARNVSRNAYADNEGIDAGLDRTNVDYRMHTPRANIAVTQIISMAASIQLFAHSLRNWFLPFRGLELIS